MYRKRKKGINRWVLRGDLPEFHIVKTLVRCISLRNRVHSNVTIKKKKSQG